MKSLGLIIFTFLLCSSFCRAQSPEVFITYQTEINLLQEDQLQVVATVNQRLDLDTATFCFPAIVPGIYGKMHFGQFVSNVVATSTKGELLTVTKLDQNRWQINDARDLKTITYRVDDCWEQFDMNLQEGFYRSAGSTFSEESFLINNNCLFGYFEGYTDRPINVAITHDSDWYGATSLTREAHDENKDLFVAASYHELVDNPILYSEPDTALFNVDGVAVEVACHSTGKEKIAPEIAAYIKPLLENQRKYLGGELPVDRYTFIIYHQPNTTNNSTMGDGLEHSNSTVILLYMPLDIRSIKENVYGIASHEFFHVLMPLGLHSHEIADYDFNHPELSRHLWLYEGMTEYYTIHMPLKNGLQSLADFCREVSGKAQMMQRFTSDVPLTQLSLNAMDMQDRYYDVYLRGALVNLCLDIRLRELSGGEYGVQNLVSDLTKRYGPDRPFEDEDLFDEIVELSGFPEIGVFIEDYISGAKPLPMEAYLAKVGLNFDAKKQKASINENSSKEQLKLREAWMK